MMELAVETVLRILLELGGLTVVTAAISTEDSEGVSIEGFGGIPTT